MWILYAGVSKTQEDTLQVFIIKIEMCNDNWGIKTRNTTDNNGNWQTEHKILLLLYDYLGLNKELQFYSGKLHILTDHSATSTCPLL